MRSLHSTTIQPQVEGRVTKIFVKSGDLVRAGAPLVQIDPEKQAATVRSTESQRAAREADVTYWKAQVERLKSLLEAGAISQNEFDQAQHKLDSAAGEPRRAQRAGARGPGAAAVLPRHRADAGIVGDIAVGKAIASRPRR